jgi:hypothetical protein
MRAAEQSMEPLSVGSANLYPLDRVATRMGRFDPHEPQTVLVPDAEVVPVLLVACRERYGGGWRVPTVFAPGDDDGDTLPVLTREQLLRLAAPPSDTTTACWRYIDALPPGTRFALLFY